MCHSDSRLPAAGVAILTNILDSQIAVYALWNFWRKMELNCIHVSFRQGIFLRLRLRKMKAKKKCTVENIRNNLGRNFTHAEQRQEKLWEVCRQQRRVGGSKCWLVLRNLLSLHFGAESHQPAARGVTKQILLGALYTNIDSAKCYSRYDQNFLFLRTACQWKKNSGHSGNS